MKTSITLTILLLLAVSSRAQECKDQLEKVQRQLKDASESLSKVKSDLQQEKKHTLHLTAKITELEKKLAAGPFHALIEQASASAAVFKARLFGILTDLQAGKLDKAAKFFEDGLYYISSSIAQLKSLVWRELDEHLPAVKKALQDGLTRSNEIYESHIKGKLGGFAKQLTKVTTELEVLIKSLARQYPALKPLEDPVNLQLVVYAIIVAPVALLLLLPILLWIAFIFSPATDKSSNSNNGKGAKGKAGKPNKKK